VNARDLERYKKLLLAKRDDLSAPNEARTLVPPAGSPEGDLMDQASADAEAELQIRLHATDGRLLKAIEDALTRLRAGTFGVCEVCKQPISKPRLEAVPWTRLCRECKE
jgi:RNA polymerase-binding transcription factor